MKEQLQSFKFTVPVERIGEVMGKLAKLGAWPDGLEPENDDGQIVCEARLPAAQIESVRAFVTTIPEAKMESVE